MGFVQISCLLVRLLATALAVLARSVMMPITRTCQVCVERAALVLPPFSEGGDKGGRRLKAASRMEATRLLMAAIR